MMWWWGNNPMGAGGWIGMGFMIVFWVAIVIGIIYLVRYLAHPGWWGGGERPPYPHQPGSPGPGQAKSDALRILEERYARGEIDREEFAQRRQDLQS